MEEEIKDKLEKLEKAIIKLAKSNGGVYDPYFYEAEIKPILDKETNSLTK